MTKMKANWQVEDGYVGGSRPQVTQIDIEDIAEQCTNRDDAERLVCECIEDHFREKISWDCDNLNEIVDAVMAKHAELQKANE